MIQRLILPLALRSLLLAIAIALVTSVFLAPVRLLRGEQAMSATLRDVSAGISWTGSSVSSAAGFESSTCQSTGTCDVFTLNVDVSNEYRKANPNFALSVRIIWDEPRNDFDLYVAKDGRTIKDSRQGQTNSEELQLNQPANGLYQIFTHNASAGVWTIYNGRVRLLAAPLAPTKRAAQYVKDPDGKYGPEHFQFAPELVLDPSDAAGARTDIEIDPFGNAYVAADGSDMAIGEPQFQLGKVYTTDKASPSRQWAAALGGARFYVASVHNSRLVVRRSEDGGRTFKQEALVTRLANSSDFEGLGNLITDRARTLFSVFTGTSGNEIYMAKCVEPCARFVTRRIFSGGAGVRVNYPYPVIALDRAGGLHVAFSEGQNIFLISSADGGTTWKDPLPLNNPDDRETETATAPWIFAGDSGRVGVTWLGANGEVFYGLISDAFAAEPAVHYVRIGDAQPNPNLPSGTADPFGTANLVFGQTRLMRQIGGERLLFGPFMTAAGFLKTETGTKRISFNVRQDFTGSLTYLDEQRGLSLRSANFSLARKNEKTISLSGRGRLQDGSEVTFTLVTSDPKANEKDFSISMSNGYFAAGALQGPASLEANVQRLDRRIH